MCGINGFNWEDASRLRSMNESIAYRGPDDSGCETAAGCSLGLLRLAIIDLSPKGHQPMFSHDKELCIVFNGEIYNYQELREEHCKDYPFSSGADTEVILAMYERYGEKCVEYFNGMWGLAIHDRKRNLLFCSRDRLGIKPFHYYHKGGKFIFSSELKAILAHEDITFHLDPRAISSYLRYRYVLEEGTFFSEIRKLKPGHNIVYDLQRKELRVTQYWDVPQEETCASYTASMPAIEEGFLKAVRYRMIADVEVGSILSGGLDSSLISAAMAKLRDDPINTYTVRFAEEGYDETAYARIVAERYKTVHHEITIDAGEYRARMEEYLRYKDEPIGVPNEVALYLLFKEIKKTATVVLAGEGADEIFAGYGRIFRAPFEFEQDPMGGTDASFVDFFLSRYGYFTEEDMNVLKPEFRVSFREVFAEHFERCPRDRASKISYVFLKLHLPGLLARTDQSSMAASVECRVPFIDPAFVGEVFRLPFEYKNAFLSSKDMQESIGKSAAQISEIHDRPKRMLKDIAREYLPEGIIERKKQGFPLPLNAWFGDELRKEIADLLLGPCTISRFLDKEALGRWMEEHNDPMFGQKLWMLYSLETWLAQMKERRNVIL